ncbi:MAG: hypothetical protein J3Q66DRAFT_438104 [Benniella sp.]|nr:MAG: hypothetical protein J3Q66DRAFT_438104 [Benniella sp.]
MSYAPLFYAVGFGIFIVSLLFCHAYDISNSYVYYPLATFLGYTISMRFINHFMPTAFDPPPPSAPKTRQEKKRAAKDAEATAKRNEKTARAEADAARKLAEARKRD